MRRTMLLLLAVLVACGTVRTVPRSGSTDGVVPWVDTAFPTPSASPAPDGAGACSADALELAAFGNADAAAGTRYAEAEVRNVSSKTCALTPKSSVLYRNGDDEIVQNSSLETYGEAVFVPTEDQVAQGAAQRVSLRLAIPNVCPPPVATTLEISMFPGTETMTLPPGSGGPPPSPAECFAAGQYILSAERPATDSESQLAVLEAAIRAPELVVPGSSFRYLVDLENPSAAAVSLDPCPGYAEGFKAPNGGKAAYVLNCTTVTSIAAGATVTYEMVLEVPEEFGAETNPERQALLTWGILGGGPSANAWVRVAG